MQKLKNVLKPGHAAEDEVLYGTSDPTHHPPPANEPQLHTEPKAEKNHTVLRQMFNPGGNKYDETRFTTTATTEEPAAPTVAGGDEEALQSGTQAKKDTGLMRQILNPGGDKYDETRYGTTGTTQSAEREAAHAEPGHPSGATSTGYASRPAAGTSLLPPPQHTKDDGMSTASIKSGVSGQPQTADPPLATLATIESGYPSGQHNAYGSGTAGMASSGIAGSSAQQAVRGDEGTTATSVQPFSTNEHHEGYAHVAATQTARKFSLGGTRRPEWLEGSPDSPPRTTYNPSDPNSASPSRRSLRSSGGPYKTSHSPFFGSGVEGPPVDASRHGTAGTYRDGRSSDLERDVMTAGAAAAAGGAGAYAYDSGHNRYDSTQSSTGPAPHTVGPHQSDTLNVLDPRVQPQPEKMVSGRAGPTSTDPAPHTVGPHKSDALNVLDPRVQPQPERMTSGRAGPTGADPAPHTVGPHKSDTANILDPRVQPQPEKQGARSNKGGMAAAGIGAGAGALAGAGLASQYGSRPGPGDRENTQSYQDRGPLSDLSSNQQPGQKHRGWQNPYSSAGVDPRVDDIPGAFPETPYDEIQDPQSGRHENAGSAAVAGAGAGAVGVGAYEAAQPYSENRGQDHAASSGPGIGMAMTTDDAVAHSSQPSYSREADNSHHYGRDALVAGGVGAAGVGTYEAAKNLEQSRSPPSKPTTSTTPRKLSKPAPPNQLSNREIYGAEAVTPKPVGSGPTQAGIGRGAQDAVLGGGEAGAAPAPAAGAGAYEASRPSEGHDHTSPPAHLRAAHNIYPSEVFQPHHQQPTSAATAGGLTGDSATGDDRLRQQQQQQERHYGRDATIGAGAVGAAGASAYGLESQTGRTGHVAQQQPTITATTHDIYPETALQMHPHQPTSAETAGGTGFDHATGEQSQHHYGRDAALAGGAAAGGVGAYNYSSHPSGAGIGTQDYAPRPTAAQSDPVAALQGAVTQGYDDQRAAPLPGQEHFDPVRGGTLDNDGVSHPHTHSHPQYVTGQQPDQSAEYHNRNVAAAGGFGAAAAGATYLSAREAHQPSDRQTFDTMDPTSAARGHRKQLSTSSSKYSDDPASLGRDSPSGKRKHKILTFLNKDKSHSRQASQTSQDLDQQPHDYASLEKRESPLGGLGGAEGHEFSGNRASEEMGSSAGLVQPAGVETGGSLRSKQGAQGRNKLHKQPPKSKLEQSPQQQPQQQPMSHVQDAPPQLQPQQFGDEDERQAI